jgi:hypothetical protein
MHRLTGKVGSNFRAVLVRKERESEREGDFWE